MHFLRRVARQLDGLDRFIQQVCENQITQGVVVDLNPIWLTAYRMEQAGLDPHFMDKMGPFYLGFGFPPVDDILISDQGGEVPLDFSWKPPDGVDFWCHQLFGRTFGPYSPFLVKVVTFPLADPELVPRRRALVEIARAAPFPAIVETRQPAKLVVSPSDPCLSSSGIPGTVGGFLKDRNSGKVYATTCGHVVASGPVSVHGAVIGQCTHATVPTPVPAGQLCHSKSPHVSRLDVALIDVTGAAVTNAVSSIAPIVYPRESVRATGSVTGTASYQVGGAGMIYQIGGICFGNIFEVRPPYPSSVVSPRFRALTATVPKGGDSGTWVERTGTPDWCGIIVAADHAMGYAMDSDAVVSEANTAFKMDLILA